MSRKMKRLSMLLATNIKALRKSRRLTQAALAEAARVSIQNVAAVESGRNWPKLSTLEALARALGITEVELFRSSNDVSSHSVVTALRQAFHDNSACWEDLEKLLNSSRKRRNGCANNTG